MEKLIEYVRDGNAQGAVDIVSELLEKGEPAEKILTQALIPAMDEVGDLFQQGEYFLPEMLVAARAMKQALAVLKPKLLASGVEPVGKVVVGTVKGDLHDIGKNLVAIALEGAGMEVIDLGIDVPAEKFIDAIREHQPLAVGFSALLTTTMIAMGETIKEIEKSGLRDSVKIMVGGAPLTKEFAEEVGADYYGADPNAGKEYIKGLIG